MEGTVLGFDAGSGVIRTPEGTRYRFSRSEWKSPAEPRAGARVDFVADGDAAREIYLLTSPIPGAISDTLESMERSEKTIPTLVYLCYIGGLFWGVTMIVGVVLAYLYRDGAAATWYRSHFDYQIGIFWKSLLGFVLAFVLIFFGVGLVVLVATWVWVIVKVVKGWRLLADGQPVPAP